MEAHPQLSVFERQTEDLGKAECSETTNTSSIEADSGKRTRNTEGYREHVCQCGKAYLSWAAFYTHCKTKHPGKIPQMLLKSDENAPQIRQSTASKPTKPAMPMAGKPAPQKKQREIEDMSSEIRRFLKSKNLQCQTPEVGRPPHLEAVHDLADFARHFPFKRFPPRIRTCTSARHPSTTEKARNQRAQAC